jgi:hypothetical protein
MKKRHLSQCDAPIPVRICKASLEQGLCTTLIVVCCRLRDSGFSAGGSAGFPGVSRGRRRWLWRCRRGRGRSPVFFTIMLALLHRLLQFLLVISKQSMNLAVRFVADSVNLRKKLLPRSCRILIEQRLNPIVVLLKQRPDLLLLFRSQLQIFRKACKFLVDRLRRMDMLKLLSRRGLLDPIVLSYGRTGHSEHEHNPIGKVKGRFRMDSNLLEGPIYNPSRDPDLNRRTIPPQVALRQMQSDLIGLHKRPCRPLT